MQPKKYELTIGMAVYDDYARTCMTIQALRMYQDMRNVEILIIANKADEKLKEFVSAIPDTRYIEYTAINSTAQPRNMIFEYAYGKAVLVIDCHVMLWAGSVARLKKHYQDNPLTNDLYQGPMIYENLDPQQADNMWSPMWGAAMLGTFTRAYHNNDTDMHEIVAQGLGLFTCRKDAWLGFNRLFRGFGGEEGYIHEKYRQHGRKCWSLPWLKWWHHSVRETIPYENTYDDRIRNYTIGFTELKLSVEPTVEHILECSKLDIDYINKIVAEARAECSV